VGTADGKVLSWLQCYGVQQAAGYGSISVARLGEGLMSLRNAGATAKFVDHCFTALGLRKLYFETSEPSFNAFESMRGELLVEHDLPIRDEVVEQFTHTTDLLDHLRTLRPAR
jgi:hypothetical protein